MRVAILKTLFRQIAIALIVILEYIIVVKILLIIYVLLLHVHHLHMSVKHVRVPCQASQLLMLVRLYFSFRQLATVHVTEVSLLAIVVNGRSMHNVFIGMDFFFRVDLDVLLHRKHVSRHRVRVLHWGSLHVNIVHVLLHW